MPVSFQILPHRQLILFIYSGKVTFQESSEIVGQSARHPAFSPWLRHLCDLSRVTGVERDYLKLLKMHAKIAEDLRPSGHDLLVLFYAPNRAGQSMAEMARRSWQGQSGAIVMIHDREAEALAMFGLRETSMDELLQSAE